MMSDAFNWAAAGGVATGVIIVATTGAWWTLLPIGAAVYVARLAARVLEADEEKPGAAKPAVKKTTTSKTGKKTK